MAASDAAPSEKVFGRREWVLAQVLEGLVCCDACTESSFDRSLKFISHHELEARIFRVNGTNPVVHNKV